MKQVHGRIVDAQVAGAAGPRVVLLSGSEQHALDLAPGQPPVEAGDLVTLARGEQGAEVVAIHARAGAKWDPEGDGLRWRAPAAAPSRMHLLFQRQAILRAVRDYFYEQGFLEVQAPLLVRGTCPDAHIDSLSVGDAYLTTSTEYQIKRMEVGGFDKVFTLTQNFRGADIGARHNPEFTMLEWARTFATLDDIERDAEALVKRAHQAVSPGGGPLVYEGKVLHLDAPRWERLTVRGAFEEHLGMRLDGGLDHDSLRREATRLGLDIPASFLADEHLLFSFLVDAVQARLGAPTPTFLVEWPSIMTSSAALLPGAGTFTERSELVIAGIELSDGFPSLRDPDLQRRLFAREQARRAREGKPAVVLDERYLAALEQGIPPGAGMALGFDRLVMLLTGRTQIRDVIPFAWDEL
ncbi:MAG: amino acid--tRNA ligase-related protein [Byssovorax sp.]